jgi:hypothetical protein
MDDTDITFAYFFYNHGGCNICAINNIGGFQLCSVKNIGGINLFSHHNTGGINIFSNYNQEGFHCLCFHLYGFEQKGINRNK